MINNKDNLENHPIYAINTNIGSAMFYNDICTQESMLNPSEDVRDEAK